jgi:UDP-N-acetylmuramoylalanine--D-glutamate ligase
MSSKSYINGDDELCLKAAEGIDAETVTFGFGNKNDYYAENITAGKFGFCYDVMKAGEKLVSLELKAPGRHNVLNYMAAYAATAEHVSLETVKKIAVEFGGVEHRIELVRELDGVKYYNSSIDSTPTRTAAALSSFKEKVIVICGGYDKNLSYEPLAVTLCEKAKAVVVTGACAPKILAALEGYEGYKSSGLRVYKEPIFESAVKKTRELAKNGDTVILSPAAASFDAFENFMVRGNTFKKIVNSFENK